MNYDDILKKINKMVAERFMKERDELFGQAHQQQRQAYDAFRAQEQARARQGMSDDQYQAFAYGLFTQPLGKKPPERIQFPDDGKTITLTKDDYKEEEPCQTDPPQLEPKSTGDGTDE